MRKRLTGDALTRRNRAILLRDQGICQDCYQPVVLDVGPNHPKAPNVDHVVPWSLGGTDEPSNLRLVHRACNRRKSDKPPPVESPSRAW